MSLLNPVLLMDRFNRLLSQLESFLLGSTLLLALGFAFLQVILRNFFDTGISWADVFTRHLVVWIGFFGATLSTQLNKHICIDALAKIVPKKYKIIIDLLIGFFCVVVGSLLTNSAYKFVIDEKMSGSILFEQVPTWYFMVIMPAGFAIITFRYFVRMVDLLYQFAGRKKPTDKAPQELELSVKIRLK